MTDQINKAIAATEKTIEMMAIPVTLSSSGKPAQINIPADMTEGELAELCGWILTAVLGHIRARKADPASRIQIVRSMQ